MFNTDMFMRAGRVSGPQATRTICVVLIKPCDGPSEQDISTKDTKILANQNCKWLQWKKFPLCDFPVLEGIEVEL